MSEPNKQYPDHYSDDSIDMAIFRAKEELDKFLSPTKDRDRNQSRRTSFSPENFVSPPSSDDTISSMEDKVYRESPSKTQDDYMSCLDKVEIIRSRMDKLEHSIGRQSSSSIEQSSHLEYLPKHPSQPIIHSTANLQYGNTLPRIFQENYEFKPFSPPSPTMSASQSTISKSPSRILFTESLGENNVPKNNLNDRNSNKYFNNNTTTNIQVERHSSSTNQFTEQRAKSNEFQSIPTWPLSTHSAPPEIASRHFPEDLTGWTMDAVTEEIALILMQEMSQFEDQNTDQQMHTSSGSPSRENREKSDLYATVWRVSRPMRTVCARAAVRLVRDSVKHRLSHQEVDIDTIVGNILSQLGERESIMDLRGQKKRLQDEVQSLEQSQHQLTRNIDTLATTLEDLQQQLERGSRLRGTLDLDTEAVKRQKMELTHEINRLTALSEQLQGTYQKELQHLNKLQLEVEDWQRKYENITSKVRQQESQMSQIKEQCSLQILSIQQQLETMTDRHGKLQVEEHQLKVEISRMMQDLADVCKQYENTKQSQQAINQQMKIQTQHLEQREQKEQSLKTEVLKLQSQLTSLQSDYSSQMSTANQKLQSLQLDIHSMELRLRDVTDEYQQVELKLKNRKIQVEEEEVKLRKMESEGQHSRSQLEAECSKLKLTLVSLKQDVDIKSTDVSHLQSETKRLQSLTEEFQTSNHTLHLQLSTVTSNIARAKHTYEQLELQIATARKEAELAISRREQIIGETEGDVRAVQSLLETLHTLQMEEKRYMDIISQGKEEYQELEGVNNKLKNSLRESIQRDQAELKSIQQQLHSSTLEFHQLQGSIRDCRLQLSELEARRAEELKSSLKLSDELVRVRKLVESAETRSSQLQQRETDCQQRESQVALDRDRIQRDLDRLQELQRDERTGVSTLELKKSMLTTELENTSKQMETQKSQLYRLQAEVTALQDQLLTVRAAWSESESRKNVANRQLDTLQQTISQQETMKLQNEQQIQRLQLQIKNLEELMATRENQIRDLSLEIQKQQVELEEQRRNVRETLHTQFRITPSRTLTELLRPASSSEMNGQRSSAISSQSSVYVQRQQPQQERQQRQKQDPREGQSIISKSTTNTLQTINGHQIIPTEKSERSTGRPQEHQQLQQQLQQLRDTNQPSQAHSRLGSLVHDHDSGRIHNIDGAVGLVGGSTGVSNEKKSAADPYESPSGATSPIRNPLIRSSPSDSTSSPSSHMGEGNGVDDRHKNDWTAVAGKNEDGSRSSLTAILPPAPVAVAVAGTAGAQSSSLQEQILRLRQLSESILSKSK